MNQATALKPFPLGRILITSAVEESIAREEIDAALGRHARGDWGDLCASDAQLNELSLREGGRLFSSFTDRMQTRFYVITESDRSVTTVLVPADY